MKINLLNKYKEMPAAVRTSVWFTVCQFLQRGIAFITVPIFTRLLTTEEYGICNIYFAWFDVFILFTSLKLPYEGLNNGLIRYEDDKDIIHHGTDLGPDSVCRRSVSAVS